MAVSATPIYPQGPLVEHVDLTAQTACTTRAPTATASLAAANIVELCAASTNGKIVESIKLKANGTGITTASAANILLIWEWDATKAWCKWELPIAAVTPNTTTTPSAEAEYVFKNGLWLPATHKLYVALTVTTTAAGTALSATAFSGLL